jgi:ParB family chromosome partitioning protein
MLSSSQYKKGLIGTIDDIYISDITQSINPLRNSSESIQELSDSIGKIGLLSPILVRITESGKFELVAGNRRFKACKLLGCKTIQCHIVELDSKSAFEASIIENIQRKTLNIMEEALAFRKYVQEFGWGAGSELAHKLSKSSSYISKRMRLLDLPADVLQLLCESDISVSTGEELLSIKEKDRQCEFAKLVLKQGISSRELRTMIQNGKDEVDDSGITSYSYSAEDEAKHLKSFSKSIITLKIALNKIGMLLEKIEDNWVLYEILMNHRNTLHSQIDLLIREQKKYIKRNHFFKHHLEQCREIRSYKKG